MITFARFVMTMDQNIKIFGAKQNNLKNLNVEFETGKITVVTGVSGSGKEWRIALGGSPFFAHLRVRFLSADA